MPEVQFSFHFTNLAEEVGIVVLVCVVRQMRPKYFNGVFDAVKFQYFVFFLCFEEPIHIALVFFLFRRKPDMLPKLPMICNENFRELVSLDIRVVSSANCEILASCRLGRRMPLQFGSCRIFYASNSAGTLDELLLRQ